MKICFYNVTACYIPGGLETYCWEVGRALARRGHDVTIVAGAAGSAWHNEVKLVQYPFRIAETFPNFGTRYRRLMERLSFARHSLSHLIDTPYDAVIVNKPFDFPILWWARRRGMRAQTLFRSGGTDFFATDRRFANAIDHWVSSSRYNAAQVEARYGRRVTVIHNGVDTARFHPQSPDPALRVRLGLPKEARLIASVGRLVGWKGHRVIIDTLPRLPADVHYLLVGEGPEEPLLRQRANDLGVAARLHVVGRIGHNELPAVLNLAEIFAQPSIGEEAFGISVVEAMACALPVIASKNGGLMETVVDGETGRLLPSGQVDAWAEAIATLLADSAQLKRMGRSARERAEAHFTWAANAGRVEQMLAAERKSCAA